LKQQLLSVAFACIAIFFCGTSGSASEKIATSVKTIPVNVQKSTVSWVGKKILGQHKGKIKLQSGSVYLKDEILTGGTFVIDMRTISNEDIKDPDYKKKLIGHLSSSDFFNVEAFPTATAKITKVVRMNDKSNEYTVTADFTIKGITKSVTFPATFKTTGNGFEGRANITLDRTLWDIRYGSSNFFEGLGDKAIKNEFELDVKIAG